MKPHVLHMTQFVEHIAGDEDASDGVIAASCGLVGYENLITARKRSCGKINVSTGFCLPIGGGGGGG